MDVCTQTPMKSSVNQELFWSSTPPQTPTATHRAVDMLIWSPWQHHEPLRTKTPGECERVHNSEFRNQVSFTSVNLNLFFCRDLSVHYKNSPPPSLYFEFRDLNLGIRSQYEFELNFKFKVPQEREYHGIEDHMSKFDWGPLIKYINKNSADS